MPEPNRFVAGGYHDMHADAYGNGGGRCETVILLLIIIHYSCRKCNPSDRHSPNMNKAGLISCRPTRAVGCTRDSVGYTRRTGACGATNQSWTQSCYFRLVTILLISPEVHMGSCTPYFQRDKRRGWVSSTQSPTKVVDRDMEYLGFSTLLQLMGIDYVLA